MSPEAKKRRNEQSKEYHYKHRDRILARKRKYNKNNKDKIHKYYMENKTKAYERAKIWKKANPDKIKLYQKTYRDKHPQKKRDEVLRRQFGITLDDYQVMLLEQNSVCAICKLTETLARKNAKKIPDLSVDHCHTTGKIRGLLCTKCNTGLGLFKDNIELLQTAINYLTKERK